MSCVSIEMECVKIKVNYLSDNLQLSIKRCPVHLLDLYQFLQSHYQLNIDVLETIVFKYSDPENDLITICSDESLEYALSEHEKQNTSTAVFKVFATTSSSFKYDKVKLLQEQVAKQEIITDAVNGNSSSPVVKSLSNESVQETAAIPDVSVPEAEIRRFKSGDLIYSTVKCQVFSFIDYAKDSNRLVDANTLPSFASPSIVPYHQFLQAHQIQLIAHQYTNPPPVARFPSACPVNFLLFPSETAHRGTVLAQYYDWSRETWIYYINNNASSTETDKSLLNVPEYDMWKENDTMDLTAWIRDREVRTDAFQIPSYAQLKARPFKVQDKVNVKNRKDQDYSIIRVVWIGAVQKWLFQLQRVCWPSVTGWVDASEIVVKPPQRYCPADSIVCNYTAAKGHWGDNASWTRDLFLGTVVKAWYSFEHSIWFYAIQFLDGDRSDMVPEYRVHYGDFCISCFKVIIQEEPLGHYIQQCIKCISSPPDSSSVITYSAPTAASSFWRVRDNYITSSTSPPPGISASTDAFVFLIDPTNPTILNPRLRIILHQIFKRWLPLKTAWKDLSIWLFSMNHQVQSLNENARLIIQQFGVTEADIPVLKLDGFIDYYMQMCRTCVDQVYNDLYRCGYDELLQPLKNNHRYVRVEYYKDESDCLRQRPCTTGRWYSI